MEDYQIICQLLADQYKDNKSIGYLQNLTDNDWESLKTISRKNRISPILYKILESISSQTDIPDSILMELRNDYFVNAARNTYLLHEGSRILAKLNEIEIPVISLKGLYLAENVYKNPVLRSMSDLDILVNKKDIPGVISVLHELGYQASRYFNMEDGNLDIKHVPPFINHKDILVELHWTILAENEPVIVDVDGLWNRAMPAVTAGVNSLALSIEDLILHLSIHLTYQHKLRLGLRGLVDLALVVNQNYDLVNWKSLVQRAKAWRAERILGLTLHLLEDLLLIPIPESVFRELTEQPIPTEILTQARDQFLNKNGNYFIVTPDLARLSADPGWIHKVQVIFSRIFLPKSTIARLYAVNPHSLKIYLYYPVRFYQLLRYYTGVVFRILTGDEQTLAGSSRMEATDSLKNWLGNKI